MRHLLLITTSYPFDDSGSEAAGAFVADLAEALAERMRITVIAPGFNEESKKITQNLTVNRFKVSSLPLSLLKVSNPSHWYPIVSTLFHGRKAVQRVAAQESVDHILALWVLPSGYWAKSIGRQLQIPYSTWALGSDIWSLGKIPLVKSILKSVLKDSYCNFADGHQLKDDVAALSGRECLFLPSSRKLVISKSKKYASSPPYKFAFLGRWHRNKGVDLLVESLALLNDHDWKNIELVKIYGGGPLKNQVEESVELLREQGRPVSFGGYLDKEKAVELFLWADYVLIPSRIESIPVVFSDAMKCGCPVVCLPVGDLPRLITENGVGVLAENIAADSFANAVKAILETSPEAFSGKLTKTAELFSLESVSQLLDDNLNSLSEDHL